MKGRTWKRFSGWGGIEWSFESVLKGERKQHGQAWEVEAYSPPCACGSSRQRWEVGWEIAHQSGGWARTCVWLRVFSGRQWWGLGDLLVKESARPHLHCRRSLWGLHRGRIRSESIIVIRGHLGEGWWKGVAYERKALIWEVHRG